MNHLWLQDIPPAAWLSAAEIILAAVIGGVFMALSRGQNSPAINNVGGGVKVINYGVINYGEASPKTAIRLEESQQIIDQGIKHQAIYKNNRPRDQTAMP